MTIKALTDGLRGKLGVLVDGSHFSLTEVSGTELAIDGTRRLCRVSDPDHNETYYIEGNAIEAREVAKGTEEAVAFLTDIVLEGSRLGYGYDDPSQIGHK